MTQPVVTSDERDSPAESPNQPRYGDQSEAGKLLDPTVSGEDIHTFLRDQWSQQNEKYARRIAEAELNQRRRAGETNIWVERVGTDQALFRVYEAPGTPRYGLYYQKAHRACLRLVAHLYQDIPEPNPIPSTGEQDDKDAAEFAGRVLKQEASESGLDDAEAHIRAQDTASNWGSGWIWYYLDPRGGGRVPIEVNAHPEAQSAEQAMLDPVSGAQWQGPTVNRYVAADGTLTNDPNTAALQWLPKLARQVTDPGHVRLFPNNAQNLWEASGLLYGAYETWDTVVSMFPLLAQASTEERDRAISYRHSDFRHLLPRKGRRVIDPRPKVGHEGEGLCLLLVYWTVEQEDYPEGAHVATVGDRLIAVQELWRLSGKKGSERRDLPWTQVLQWRGDSDTPTGWGAMDFLGPLAEQHHELGGRMLDFLDRALNRKTFLPIGGTIQPQDLQLPFATALPFQPGFEPKWEEVPPLPPDAYRINDLIQADFNDALGLQATGQGIEASNVQSGRHALAIVSQVQADLADVNRLKNRAFERGWRIQLQEIRTGYTVPRLMRTVGKDGGYKVERWLGSDLGSTRDVAIKPGTGTLMNPMQKAEIAASFQQLAGLDVDDVRELLTAGYTPYVALEDDPILMRVRGQLKEWLAGPPPGWEPAPPPQQQIMEGLMGPQPIMVPSPPDLVLARIFDPRPVDTSPLSARVRIREIGRTMAGTGYGEKPAAWKAGLDAEFGRMQQALAPPAPVPPEMSGQQSVPEQAGPTPGAPPLQRGEAEILNAPTV